MSQRQIDDVDAKAGAVHNREVDRADDVARETCARPVQHFQDDELHLGCEAVIRVVV